MKESALKEIEEASKSIIQLSTAQKAIMELLDIIRKLEIRIIELEEKK